MQGCDTPATRPRSASHGAKPPSPPASSALQWREGQAGAPVGVGSPATAHAEGATAKQISPNKNHAAPLRYKTLPAHPFSPHVRYKTLPAHPKWLDLAHFLHAGRVLYRCHHQEAEQGEFCTEREAESGLANTTAHQAPPVWRTSEGPVWRAPEKPEGTGEWRPGGPGRTTSRRAERSSRRGRLAGGPPPTGTHSGRAPQSSPASQSTCGARNIIGATSIN